MNAPDHAPIRHLVLCFGNELHGDDGFGPAVGRLLTDPDGTPLPPGWAVHQIGTRGLDALALLHDCDTAILIDASAPQGRPGRLHEPASIGIEKADGHGTGLGWVLRALRAGDGPQPKLRLLCAEMSEVSMFHMHLSAAVAAAVAPAAAQVRGWMEAASPIPTPAC